jgi:hypothetical protein
VSGAAAIGSLTAVPQQVREEGAGAVRGYEAAMKFEAMLLQQMLAEALPEASGSGSGAGEGEDASGAFGSGDDPSLTTLPETVAQAVVGAGGLGLAGDMYHSFEGASR